MADPSVSDVSLLADSPAASSSSSSSSSFQLKERPIMNEEEEEYEDQDEEEEGDAEEEDEEEDEEPILKYQRFQGPGIQDILKQYSITAITAHEKMMVIGSHLGAIHVLDWSGEEIRRIACHSSAVNDVDIDITGEYVASCADDGKVSILSLFDGTTAEYDFKLPVLAVCLSPKYASNKKFAYGGKAEALVVSSQGWFGRSETVVHQGEGPITTIRWRGSFLAWANSTGVKVYESHTHQRITFVPRPKELPRADTYPCTLLWANDTDLWISWGSSVQVCRISPSSHQSHYYGTIIASIKLDFIVPGIVPFGHDRAIAVGYTEKQTAMQPAEKPELLVVDRRGANRWQVVSSDAISVREFQRARVSDYKIVGVPTDSALYLIAPRDIITVRPRDRDDHITWLKSKFRFEDALICAHRERSNRVVEVTNSYLEHLFKCNKVGEAANECRRLLGESKELWESWMFRFRDAGHLLQILDSIPSHPRLRTSMYDMVVAELLAHDHFDLLSQYIVKWSNGNGRLFSGDFLLVALEQRAQNETLSSSKEQLQKCIKLLVSDSKT